MSIRQAFYTITQTIVTEKGHRYDLELLADHPIFEGHFPDDPILPGVCLLQMAEELVQHCTGHPMALQRIRQAKFLNPVRPTHLSRLTAVLLIHKQGEQWRSEVQFFQQNHLISSIKADLIARAT